MYCQSSVSIRHIGFVVFHVLPVVVSDVGYTGMLYIYIAVSNLKGIDGFFKSYCGCDHQARERKQNKKLFAIISSSLIWMVKQSCAPSMGLDQCHWCQAHSQSHSRLSPRALLSHWQTSSGRMKAMSLLFMKKIMENVLSLRVCCALCN